VQDVESAFTEPLSIEGAQTAVTGVLNMGLEDPLLRVLGSPRVRATVQIREVQGERVLDGVSVEVKGPGTVRPASVRVVLTGPASLLRSLTADAVRAVADLAGARVGQDVPVTIELAPGHAGLTVKEVVPATVDVRPPRATRRTR